jgi:polysaccharide export outer membrane protein
LATFIADGLRERYLKNPHVSVTVKQINSHAFFIQGAVNHPGVYQMEGRPSLLKLITVAGGLTEKHGPVAFIIREIRQTHQSSPPSNSDESAEPTPAATPASQPSNPEKSDDKYEILRVNINGLFKGDFNQNMYVEPGSIINIPPSDVFFVAGEVNAPGSFQLKEGTTLRQAISMAQGTTFTAAKSRGLIFRENPSTGQRQEIKIDIDAVMSGKKEDVQILANDIIIVPNNRFKSVSSALLSAFGLGIVRSPVRF